MNFATFALLLCIQKSNICFGPYASQEYFPYDTLTLQRNGQHNGYAACRKAANAAVKRLDKATALLNLEAYVHNTNLACKPQGMSPGYRGATTLHWGQGA